MNNQTNSTDLFDRYRKQLTNLSVCLVQLVRYCQEHNLQPITVRRELLVEMGETDFQDRWHDIRIALPFGMDKVSRFNLSGHTFHQYENGDIFSPESILIYIAGPSGWFSPDVLHMPTLIEKMDTFATLITARINDPDRDSAMAKADAYWRTKLNNVLATLEDCNKADALKLPATDRLALQDLISKLKDK